MKDNIFRCECGVTMRDPFIIRGIRMCTLCADQIAPAIVSSRTHYWQTREQRRPKEWRHKVWQ